MGPHRSAASPPAGPGAPPPTRAGAGVRHVVTRQADLPAPLEALGALAGARHVFLRHARGPGFRGTPWSFLAADPVEVLERRRWPSGETLAEVLAPLAPRRTKRHGAPVPFASGWAGSLGYEARSGVERAPLPRRAPLGFPVLWLARYDAVLAWNHRRRVAYVTGTGSSPEAAGEAAARLEARLSGARPGAAAATTGRPRPRWSRAAHEAAVAAAREAVLAGEIFQANVSQRFDARVAGSPVAFFERLAASQPAPYMTYLDLGAGRHVLSASPERFLRLRGRVLETDPMKGTRPRGGARAADRRLRAELEASEKDRAELAMIVDLSRNDLARSCRPGSVRVAVPRRILRFARVHQAIAVVRGCLRRDVTRMDALAAAFPPGSVTGAPKVRAMEVIDALEGEGRGPYCGALGWFDDGGDMDLAVAIRTIVLAGERASYRVGGGITLGSDPHAEWRESLDKGRGLFAALADGEDPT